MEKKTQIVFITIDCLRYDYFQENIQTLTRVFNGYKQSWEKMYTTGSWTPPAMVSIFTSQSIDLNSDILPIPDDKKTFIEILKKHDIITCGVHSNPFLSRLYNFNKGFDFYYDCTEKIIFSRAIDFLMDIIKNIVSNKLFSTIEDVIYKKFKLRNFAKLIENISTKKGKRLPYSEGKILLQKAISFVKAHKDDKFFLWLHMMDLHTPFKIPKLPKFSYSRRKVKKINQYMRTGKWKADSLTKNAITREDVIQLYKANLSYINNLLVRFFITMKKRLKIEPIFIITADHGDLLLDHGHYGHPVAYFEELLHVPFLIISPHKLNSNNTNQKISNLNIGPTILDIFNIKNHPAFEGKSLISDNFEEEVIVASSFYKKKYHQSIESSHPLKICIIKGKWKYIFDQHDNSEVLLNLEKDPKELNNVIEENPGLTRLFQGEIKRKIAIEDKKLEAKLIKRSILKLDTRKKI